MNELLKCVLSLSLSGTLLILLLFFCKPLLKNVPNKRWQYYLWLIVIARLLIPFAPKISLMPASDPESDRATVQVTMGTGENLPFIEPAEEGGGEFEGTLPVTVPVEGNDDGMWGYKALEVLKTTLWGVWLTGAAVLFVSKITAYQKFVKGVKNDASHVSDPRLLDLLSECGEQVGVIRPVELAVNESVSSPMLIGFFRPCIILSTVDMTESDFRYTLLHELTHERRRDILYKWLVQITLCVHWFNPFVWLMSREIDRACELACDEAVISKLGAKERVEYGDMLVNAVRIGGNRRTLTAFTALYESKKMIRERLGAIMEFRKKTKWVTLGSLSLALCLLAVSVIAGAYLIPSFAGSAEAAGAGAVIDVYVLGYHDEDAVDFGYQGYSTEATDYFSNNDLHFNDQYKVIERDGVYYILCEGVDELDDGFTAGVTDGCIMFAFLRKDGSYTSIGPFEVTETLAEEVAAQCEYMLGVDSPSIFQAEAEFLLGLAVYIQSGNVSFAEADADSSHGTTGGWEVEDFIAEAVKHITVYNKCSMLGEEDISHISNAVVRNVLESHAGVYSYDNVEVWLERNQLDGDGNIVVDVAVSAIRTLIRDPEKSPFGKGMWAAMEEFEDPEEKEVARQIIETRLKDLDQYYNVPSDDPISYCYQVYISRPDGSDTEAAEYEFYHVVIPDANDPLLAKMEEHETFTEIFTEEVGREFVRDEVQKIMAVGK